MYKITLVKLDSEGKESWYSFNVNSLSEKDGYTLVWLASCNFRVSVSKIG